MKGAGLDVMVHIYPMIGRCFIGGDRPEYDPIAAKRTPQRPFEFLKKNFQQPSRCETTYTPLYLHDYAIVG